VIESRAVLAALFELTRQLLEARSLERALARVTDAALAVLPADHASVRLLDESGRALLAAARSGAGSDRRPHSFRRGEGVIGWIVEHGQMVRIDDAGRDERFEPVAGQGFAIGSLLGVPLWAGGRVVGVLSVTAPTANAFDADDVMLSQLLANCTAPLIDKVRLERLAMTDPNTLTYNQWHLLPRLEEEISRAHQRAAPMSLLLLDLDDFKAVNDQHGHDAGDRVLRDFADRVRECVRQGDVLVRRGGDEFALIMPHSGPAEAEGVAARICARVAAAPLRGGDGLTVPQTVSIGVATLGEGETASSLSRRADQAMYEAKRQGRNRACTAGDEEPATG
jgi:two-component system cell cycle response regulator